MKKKFIRHISFIILVLILSALFYCVLKEEQKIVIAIDPGHGGPNLDQRGYPTLDGTPECVMNNAVSTMLKDILVGRGYEVIFTKPPTDDSYMLLQERPAVANKAKADLLISIHHDSSGDEQLSGFRLFYSSYKVNLDAKDIAVIYNGKEYELISERNELDEDGGAYTVKYITDGISAFEINSMIHIYKIIDKSPCDAALNSEILANIVYQKMLALEYMAPKGDIAETIVDEEYRVLRYADMPSILIEAGYMSNPAEMLEIQKSGNQKSLALAVADGIDKYFDK